MERMRIGLIKEVPVKWDVAANWRLVERMVRLHASERVDVFVTPECYLDGYAASAPDCTPQRLADVAQCVDDSPYVEACRRIAAATRTHIVLGMTERIGERLYNCALLVGREGQIIGRYHKTHLLDHDLKFAPGQDLPVFELDVGRVGILICADRRWPEAMRTLRVKGAQVCLVPTYGMNDLANEWWMRTRAYENEMFVCFAHPQTALVVAPTGQVMARLVSSQEDVLIEGLDLSAVTDTMLKARRPELYRVLGETPPPGE